MAATTDVTQPVMFRSLIKDTALPCPLANP